MAENRSLMISDVSNLSESKEEQNLVTPEHLVLHLVLFLPCGMALVLNGITVLALVKAKSVARAMRVILINVCFANATFAFGLSMWLVSFHARWLFKVRDSSITCQVTGSAFVTGCVARFYAVTLLSIMTYVFVKHGIRKIKLVYNLTTVAVGWVLSISWSMPVYVPSYGFQLRSDGTFCILSVTESTAILFYLHLAISWLVIGIVACVVATVFALCTHCYIKQNIILENEDIKRAVMKTALALTASNAVNVFGALLIPTASAFVRVKGQFAAFLLAYYIPLGFMAASSLPTPIVMIALLKPVQISLKELFPCCCRRGRNEVHPISTASAMVTPRPLPPSPAAWQANSMTEASDDSVQ